MKILLSLPGSYHHKYQGAKEGGVKIRFKWRKYSGLPWLRLNVSAEPMALYILPEEKIHKSINKKIKIYIMKTVGKVSFNQYCKTLLMEMSPHNNNLIFSFHYKCSKLDLFSVGTLLKRKTVEDFQ